MKNRIKLIAIFPLVIEAMVGAANMGRSGLILAAILFFGSYAMQRMRMRRMRGRERTGKLRRVLAISAAIALLVSANEFVRSSRGAVENLPFATRTLGNLKGASFVTPSIYLYLTVHFGVLNQYLRQDVEHTPWGSNTFAPIYRLLARLGFETTIPGYPRFYKTPVGANTGTYLRELHADFGVLGLIVGPYLLGLFASLGWYRFFSRGSYAILIMNAYLGVVVAMSIFYIATRGGDLVISIIPALFLGMMLDRLGNPATWQPGGQTARAPDRSPLLPAGGMKLSTSD